MRSRSTKSDLASENEVLLHQIRSCSTNSDLNAIRQSPSGDCLILCHLEASSLKKKIPGNRRGNGKLDTICLNRPRKRGSARSVAGEALRKSLATIPPGSASQNHEQQPLPAQGFSCAGFSPSLKTSSIKPISQASAALIFITAAASAARERSFHKIEAKPSGERTE